MQITRVSRSLLKNEFKDDYMERSGEEPIVLGFADEESIKEGIPMDIEMYKEKYTALLLFLLTLQKV